MNFDDMGSRALLMLLVRPVEMGQPDARLEIASELARRIDAKTEAAPNQRPTMNF